MSGRSFVWVQTAGSWNRLTYDNSWWFGLLFSTVTIHHSLCGSLKLVISIRLLLFSHDVVLKCFVLIKNVKEQFDHFLWLAALLFRFRVGYCRELINLLWYHSIFGKCLLSLVRPRRTTAVCVQKAYKCMCMPSDSRRYSGFKIYQHNFTQE